MLSALTSLTTNLNETLGSRTWWCTSCALSKCLEHLLTSHLSLALSLLAQKFILFLRFLCLQDLCFFFTGFLLFLQGFLFSLISLCFVDRLHQHPFVLVRVTFSMPVKEMIEMLVNLLLLTVLSEQPAEDALSAHPQHLRWHTCFPGTSAFSDPRVTALTLGIQVFPNTRTGMHLNG